MPAEFDLYHYRKWWWWYYYLSYAAAKGTPGEHLLKELIFDAIEYEEKYGKEYKDMLIEKYATPSIKGSGNY